MITRSFTKLEWQELVAALKTAKEFIVETEAYDCDNVVGDITDVVNFLDNALEILNERT